MWVRTSLLAAALTVGTFGRPAAAQPAGLPIKAVPPTANFLAVVDAEKLLASPAAAKAGWAGKTEERYRSGLGIVPPGAKRVLVAGDVGLGAGAWAWKAAVIQGADLPPLASIAEREQSEVTDATGVPVVLSPRGVYFAAPADGELAVFQPATRQALARWTAHVRDPGPGPSKYLAAAAKHAEKSHVVLALDLAHAVDPTAARDEAAALFCVVQKKVDAAAFGKFLAEAKGIRFTATAGADVRATLHFDFASNPLKYEKLLRDAILEILDNEGASLPELAKWESSYGDTSFSLSGVLSPESLERILGLLSFPHAAAASAAAEPTGPATRRYFDAVNAVVDDLKKLAKEPNYERTALWHETAARKIEALNPRGVDPAALAYARDIANRLRAIAGSLRGVPIDLVQLEKGAYAITWGAPNRGWFGMPRVGGPENIGFQTNIPQVRADQNKVVAADMKKRDEIWSQIAEMMSRARSSLAGKYKDF
jgi:hypothetical protein